MAGKKKRIPCPCLCPLHFEFKKIRTIDSLVAMSRCSNETPAHSHRGPCSRPMQGETIPSPCQTISMHLSPTKRRTAPAQTSWLAKVKNLKMMWRWNFIHFWQEERKSLPLPSPLRVQENTDFWFLGTHFLMLKSNPGAVPCKTKARSVSDPGMWTASAQEKLPKNRTGILTLLP